MELRLRPKINFPRRDRASIFFKIGPHFSIKPFIIRSHAAIGGAGWGRGGGHPDDDHRSIFFITKRNLIDFEDFLFIFYPLYLFIFSFFCLNLYYFYEHFWRVKQTETQQKKMFFEILPLKNGFFESKISVFWIWFYKIWSFFYFNAIFSKIKGI